MVTVRKNLYVDVSRRSSYYAVVVASIGVLGSCDREFVPTQIQESALTSPSDQRVFGFESASDWTLNTGSKSPDDRRTEGLHSLAVLTDTNWTEVTSAPVGATAATTRSILVDLLAPASSGNVQMFVSCPSQQVSNAWLGRNDLSSLPTGVFNTVAFAVSGHVAQKLSGCAHDLIFRIAISASPSPSEPFLLDRLRTSTSVNTQPGDVGTADQDVLGFEVREGWSVTGGTVTQSFSHSEGRLSFAVSNNGRVELLSRSLTTLASVGAFAELDVLVPPEQPNEFFYGNVELLINLPSQGVYAATLGSVDLFTLPLNVFKTIQFPIRNELATKLRRPYNDLSFRIVLNVNRGSGTYLLDNLRSDFDRRTVNPTLSCVLVTASKVTAFFGYENRSDNTVGLPVGAENTFGGSRPRRGQPTTFLVGSHAEVFSVDFDGTPISWRLGNSTVVASRTSPPCMSVVCQ